MQFISIMLGENHINALGWFTALTDGLLVNSTMCPKARQQSWHLPVAAYAGRDLMATRSM